MTFRIVGAAAAVDPISYESLGDAQEAAYGADPALEAILAVARLHRLRGVAHFGKVIGSNGHPRRYRYEGGVGPPAAKAATRAGSGRPPPLQCLALPRCQYEQVVSVPDGKIVVAIVQQEQPPESPAPGANKAKKAATTTTRPVKKVKFS